MDVFDGLTAVNTAVLAMIVFWIVYHHDSHKKPVVGK
jgi:hypothetical protein